MLPLSASGREKYLKSILEERGQAIPRTHDLLTILDVAAPNVEVPELVRDAAALLNVYSVEIRYPGTEAELADAHDAIAKAEIVEQWVASMTPPDQ